MLFASHRHLDEAMPRSDPDAGKSPAERRLGPSLFSTSHIFAAAARVTGHPEPAFVSRALGN